VGRIGPRPNNMAFTQLSINPAGAGQVAASTHMPETGMWTIFRALRDARALFGLRPGHLQTLQAMLSFLKPGHGHTVFASNNEICRRVGGIDERTLRRHIDRFVERGFMTRHDSPNGKRYRVRSSGGQCISYGLSLAPLLERAEELLALAQQIENERRDRIFLRKQILTRLAHLEEADPQDAFPHDVRKTLRRKLSLVEYRALLAKAEARCDALSTAVDRPDTIELPANDGQTVRHQSKSRKETKDFDTDAGPTAPELHHLTAICDQAMAFSEKMLGTWPEVEAHARSLAPMMGIHPTTFEKALKNAGRKKASSALFITLQLGKRIRNLAAYFHSLTLGRHVSDFDPRQLLERLAHSRPV